MAEGRKSLKNGQKNDTIKRTFICIDKLTYKQVKHSELVKLFNKNMNEKKRHDIGTSDSLLNKKANERELLNNFFNYQFNLYV